MLSFKQFAAALLATANLFTTHFQVVHSARFSGTTEEFEAECDGGRDNKQLTVKCDYDLRNGAVHDIDCTIEFCDNNSCEDDDGYEPDKDVTRTQIGGGLFNIVYDFEADPIEEDFLDDYLIDAEFFLTFKQVCDTSTEICELETEGELTCNTVVPNPLSGIIDDGTGGGAGQRAACVGMPRWRDSFGDSCVWYVDHDELGCPTWGNSYAPDDPNDEFFGVKPSEACCYCRKQGGVTPTSSPTSGPTSGPTSSP